MGSDRRTLELPNKPPRHQLKTIHRASFFAIYSVSLSPWQSAFWSRLDLRRMRVSIESWTVLLWLYLAVQVNDATFAELFGLITLFVRKQQTWVGLCERECWVCLKNRAMAITDRSNQQCKMRTLNTIDRSNSLRAISVSRAIAIRFVCTKRAERLRCIARPTKKENRCTARERRVHWNICANRARLLIKSRTISRATQSKASTNRNQKSP